MDEERKKHWLNRVAWSGFESACLMLGRDPENSVYDTEVSGALKFLSHAGDMGNLTETESKLTDLDLSFLGRERNFSLLYKPTEIINFSIDKSDAYPDFPFTMADIGVTVDAGGNDEKPLDARERNSLLAIIAALCDHAKIDPHGKGTATDISSMTQKIGKFVERKAVKGHLDRIKDI